MLRHICGAIYEYSTLRYDGLRQDDGCRGALAPYGNGAQGYRRRDCKKYGRIADIFEKYGEARFREIETEEVEELSRLDRLIIATGGGCVLSQKNVEILKRGGKIVFLSTSPEELIARVAGDTERPLLAGGAERRIRELLCVRTPKYLAAADMVTGTDGRSPEDIAAEIAKNSILYNFRENYEDCFDYRRNKGNRQGDCL